MLVPALSIAKRLQIANLFCAAALILCFVGCKREATNSPQPPATSAQPAAPAAPTRPVPSSSAAQSLGLFAYPQKGQSHDQQLIDEADCYDSAQQQSGVNPKMPAPQAPSSAQVQAAQAEAAESAPQEKGGRARGAARGAAGGAVVGAIAGGHAGAGAAVGATAGTVRGGRRQRQANEASQQQASAQAGSQLQQQYRSQKAAYDQQMNTLKRAFSACMDARGYSIK